MWPHKQVIFQEVEAHLNISITRSQLFFLIIKTQIGIGLLSLPSKIQSSAKGDAWISVLIAGGIIQLLLFIYSRLLRKFPDLTFSRITVELFGSYIGKVINIIYYVFFIFIAAYATTLYVQLVHTWMLTYTPSWVLEFLIIGTGVYLAHENLRVIARFFVLTSVLFGCLILLSFFNFTNEMHITNILPIGQSGIEQMLRGSEKTFFSMLGFEVILYFYTQVQNNSKGLIRIVSLANCFVTLFYTYFVFICVIGFSPKVLGQINEPVLYIFKGLTYQVFDRLDLIFLTIWFIPMTATIVSYLCMAGKSLSTNQDSYRRLVWFSGLLVFILGWCLSTLEKLDSFGKWLEYGYFIIITVIPLLLWLVSCLRKKSIKVGIS
ncbi:GerAB/ArcD/ProY family transporter [Paenibacillus sp. MAH-34]|uniref:GerAB/ArcD/ProY family transporter n=1 Tax=Paenibacillus anseongense TaxID=2682845 RepID=A0ABW9UNG3_9BACL|nr:GerAB/ArcD/ProY family transporter [Paenibacillus anseongense]